VFKQKWRFLITKNQIKKTELIKNDEIIAQGGNILPIILF